ncbi:MAG TPA: class I SAM-dependent methyltransferase [Stellaceae bacterium]|nr:class I SAM-dependent methyltransferase [Stellaceae bacterium]
MLGECGCDIGGAEFHLVDLGCGCGRVASFLAGLTRRGRYSGFDVWHEGIAWAQRHISPAAPWMIFRALSGEPLGYEGRRAFALPLAPASVDAVAAVSLFTHLDRAATRFYLAEIGRVLKPGGFVYMTAFLRDADTAPLLRARHHRDFVHVEEGGVSFFARGGYLDSCLDRDFLEREMARCGLEPAHLRYGSWRGPHLSTVNAAAYQDLVVARRAGGLDSRAAVPL